MSIPYEKDPMVPANWNMPEGTSFTRNEEEGVYCTGHASFTVSPDGSETWMVYHGTSTTTDINGFRIARIEKIDWSAEGVPIFPLAHGSTPQTVPKGQLTFTNPILDRNSADPGIFRLGDFYYLTLSENGERDLTIYKSPILTNFREAESKIAYSAPQEYSDLWASEMHMVDGELFIYFTMTGNGKDHRMYVTKADDPNNPMGKWSKEIRLMEDWDNAAIDGTVFRHGNGQLYFVFPTWEFGPLTIYIAPMINATVAGSPKMELKAPVEEWECHEGCVNEGPYFIFRNNVSYCVFSVSSTWGPDYALAVMDIGYEKDPMVRANWNMPEGPLFTRNDEEEVYTTGHASFTVSPDGTETWMVYHATVNTTHIDGYRISRIEKID